MSVTWPTPRSLQKYEIGTWVFFDIIDRMPMPIWNTPKRGTQNEPYLQSNVSQSPFKGTLFARQKDVLSSLPIRPVPAAPAAPPIAGARSTAPRHSSALGCSRPRPSHPWHPAQGAFLWKIHGTDLNCYEFQGPLVLRISFAIVWCNLLTNREVVSSADSKETKTKGCAMAPSALPGLNRGLDRAWMIKHLEDSSACDMCGCLRRFSTVS